jgi:putative membrane protein
MSRFIPRLAAPLALAAVAAAAAAAAPAAAQGTSPAPVTSSAGGEVARPMAPGAPMAPPVLREPVAEMFTPAKIAGVASVSNMSEIQPSQLALTKAQHPQVRQYAQRMIDEHTRLEAGMQAMLKQKGVTAEHNGHSYQKQQNLGPMTRELNAASGRDFDRLYMSHQVASHMSTLHALDTTLIPQATDAQMKAMLQSQVRPAVAQHYQEALRLRDQVAQGAGGASGTR